MKKLCYLFLALTTGFMGLRCISALGEPPAVAGDHAAPTGLEIYLLIGQSNMAGRADVPGDAEAVLDRCYLLNDKDEWEPAKNPLNRYSTIAKGETSQKLGPGYSFARKMLEQNKSIRIGLVVNACEQTTIDQWVDKSDNIKEARRRTKIAAKSGTIKGVLWQQGEDDKAAPEAYLAQLKSIIGDIRSKFDDPNLPFVAGQIKDGEAINDVIAKLPEEVHATGVVSSKGLTTTDKWHFNTESQLLLGERFAEQMIKLQQTAGEKVAAKPPTDINFIDVHIHAHPCDKDGLDIVADWMKRNHIDRSIVSPLNHKGSRDYTPEDRKTMLANFAKYKGKIDRMCIIDAGEVQTVDEAEKILRKEVADGAIAFGEHYGRNLNFDDPKNLLLYEACEKVGLPVMFHIDQNKNMVEKGMERVDNVLKKYPKCNLIAHAYWWRQLHDADRQLQQYPNLFADLSGLVVPDLLNRDRKFAREFIIRNQDKLLFGTDEGWWSFKKDPSQYKHYTFFESLNLPKEVRYKVYRGNAEKLFGWTPVGKE